ncbi:MAG: hypothetical protein Q9164_002499 [Protoblastenia rupestris]
MVDKGEGLLKRPLYVFDLPSKLLVTLQLKAVGTFTATPEPRPSPINGVPEAEAPASDETTKTSTSCLLCGAKFASVQEQREHVKSDWHNYNLKQKIRCANPVTEIEFEKLVDELDESISGSGSESSESEEDGGAAKESTLSALLKKQAKFISGHAEDEELMPKKRKRGAGKAPLIWFSTPLLQSTTSLGIYRALLTNAEQDEPDTVEVVRQKQLRPVPLKPPSADTSNGVPLPSTMTSPSTFVCMVGGGHFAGTVVSLAPKLGKQATGAEQRQAIVIAHKTGVVNLPMMLQREPHTPLDPHYDGTMKLLSSKRYEHCFQNGEI